MRKLLVLGGTALVLFGISAGISWYLHNLKQEAEGGHEPAATTPRAAATPRETNPAPTGRPAARPTYNPEADSAAQLAVKLREQEEVLRRRELQFSIRQKQLEIIHQDIRTARANIDQVRKQVDDEMKALGDKATDLEKKSLELDLQRQQGAAQVKELKQTMTEYDTVEADRIKQMAAMYDSMAPENAARILQSLLDSGSTDIAVKILASMRERQAARVLAEFREPTTAAQVVEKMKGLKRPGAIVPVSATAKQP